MCLAPASFLFVSFDTSLYPSAAMFSRSPEGADINARNDSGQGLDAGISADGQASEDIAAVGLRTVKSALKQKDCGLAVSVPAYEYDLASFWSACQFDAKARTSLEYSCSDLI